MENANFYIFTGGPGSGKSTVLDLLGNMGYRIVREVARDIIRNQVKTRGDALPWDNTVRYARLSSCVQLSILRRWLMCPPLAFSTEESSIRSVMPA